MELGLGVNVNEWTNVELVFLYEDPFENDEEGSFDLDVGFVQALRLRTVPFRRPHGYVDRRAQ